MQLTEDSFIGAMQRLREIERQRLATVTPLQPTLSQDERRRLKDLEEFALLASDENDRLEAELAIARAEVAETAAELLRARTALADATARLGSQAPALTDDTLTFDTSRFVLEAPRRSPALRWICVSFGLAATVAGAWLLLAPPTTRRVAAEATAPVGALPTTTAPPTVSQPLVTPGPPSPPTAPVQPMPTASSLNTTTPAPAPKRTHREAKRRKSVHKATKVQRSKHAAKASIGSNCKNDPLCGML
jgi:hypothetical protein